MSGFQVTEVQKALKGFSYPGSPDDLAQHADKNGGSAELVDALRALKKSSFDAPTGVMHELSAQEDALGGPTPGGSKDRGPKDIDGPSWQVTEVQHALKGASYPSSGKDLAGLAKSNGADEDLVEALGQLSDADSPAAVMKSLKDQLGGATSD